MDKEHHYPRQGNIPCPVVYSTLNKFGDPKHTLYGGKLDLGGCRTGAGTWWPDYGPTVRDFSPGGINHPTEFVFQNEVVPYTHSQRCKSMPAMPKPEAVLQKQEKLRQFRHEDPAKEALWKSVDVMPYKSAGRRKCGEASNWKAALSTGREGFRHGGRMPIWCKGPLLENPDFHQLHPLKREEDVVNIHTTCTKEGLRAGGTTGTSHVDALLLTNKTSQALGLKDSEAMVNEMTVNLGKTMSHSKTFKAGKRRLNGDVETFKTLTTSKSSPSAYRTNAQVDKGSMVSFRASLASEGDEILPSWVASSHIASRDPGAAGGQATATSIRRIAVTRAA